MNGIKRAITVDRSDDRDDKTSGTLGGLRHLVSNEVLCPKDRLILYFTISCLSCVPDRSTPLHIKVIPSLDIASPSCILCANTPKFSLLSLSSERIMFLLVNLRPLLTFTVLSTDLCPARLTRLSRRLINAGDQLSQS
jgi:hypothetical protein